MDYRPSGRTIIGLLGVSTSPVLGDGSHISVIHCGAERNLVPSPVSKLTQNLLEEGRGVREMLIVSGVRRVVGARGWSAVVGAGAAVAVVAGGCSSSAGTQDIFKKAWGV
jgi:hypothetical protein